MSISAGGNETKVGMARCAVPAAFSGGTLRCPPPRIDRLVKCPFRACTARGRRSAASLPSLRCTTLHSLLLFLKNISYCKCHELLHVGFSRG